ncbi:MAG: hypothetical protein KAS17_06040, partial [Victivallaceae bacterium]|nr:hypothetical protein [Victivallaceae bacterium]
DRSELTSADATSDANYNFAFAFDTIGNRTSYTTYETGSSVTSAYTLNNLNQYTAITNPTQSPTYDTDGDMTSDGTWDFTWNAENRLIVAEKSDAKLEFKYDYMGRRVEKKVYSGSTGNWTLDTHLKFVYNGYEQIEELNGANSDAILKKRIWGLNKIIADIHSSTAYYALGDANKNITEYLNSAGTIQAHYEYSPFGKITTKTGTMQNDFDYRFSSEVYDSETTLVYYNFRYYSPTLGRWLSRDPIEEEGGFNLYTMVHNNPVSSWDQLGLFACCDCIKYDPAKACCEGDVIIAAQSKAACDQARGALSAVSKMISQMAQQMQYLRNMMERMEAVQNVADSNWLWGNIGLTVAGCWGASESGAVVGATRNAATALDITATGVGIVGGAYGNPGYDMPSVFGLPNVDQAIRAANLLLQSYGLEMVKAQKVLRNIKKFLKNNCGRCEK